MNKNTESTAKHTPGPWNVDLESKPFQIHAETGTSKHSFWLGHMHAKQVSREQAEANGRLVAAAPDLLAACQEFVRKVDAGGARSTRSYQQMKAAIEKAGG